MKRYDFADIGYGGEHDFVMEELPKGEWVKWKDVVVEHNLLMALIQKALYPEDAKKSIIKRNTLTTTEE